MIKTYAPLRSRDGSLSRLARDADDWVAARTHTHTQAAMR